MAPAPHKTPAIMPRQQPIPLEHVSSSPHTHCTRHTMYHPSRFYFSTPCLFCSPLGSFPLRACIKHRSLFHLPRSTFVTSFHDRSNGWVLNCAHWPSTAPSSPPHPTPSGWASRSFLLRALSEHILIVRGQRARVPAVCPTSSLTATPSPHTPFHADSD